MMNDWSKELPPPEGAENEESIEVIRAWIIDGEMFFQVRGGVIEEPEAFGGMLADLAMQSSFLYAENEPEAVEAFERIMTGFEERLEAATNAGDAEGDDINDGG